jgi:hypothetical protein
MIMSGISHGKLPFPPCLHLDLGPCVEWAINQSTDNWSGAFVIFPFVLSWVTTPTHKMEKKARPLSMSFELRDIQKEDLPVTFESDTLSGNSPLSDNDETIFPSKGFDGVLEDQWVGGAGMSVCGAWAGVGVLALSPVLLLAWLASSSKHFLMVTISKSSAVSA